MKLPGPWRHLRPIRDSHPSLVQSEVREVSITISRFRKARRLADALTAQRISVTDIEAGQTDGFWKEVERASGVKESSPITRCLAMEILRDRESQQGRLLGEIEAAERMRNE